MLNLSKDIHSLTEFKRNTTRFLEHLKQTKDPLVLTVDGKAALVVQDAESYQTLLEAAELVETLKGVKRGLEEMKQGKGKKAEEFFSELFDKLDSSPWAKSIKWSYNQQAQQGIEKAYLWFSKDSPRKARLWLEGLYKAILSLEQMPYRCSLAFENNFLEEEIRQLIYGKGRSAYRILFTITGDIVQILFVRYVAQKPLSSQEDEEE